MSKNVLTVSQGSKADKIIEITWITESAMPADLPIAVNIENIESSSSSRPAEIAVNIENTESSGSGRHAEIAVNQLPGILYH